MAYEQGTLVSVSTRAAGDTLVGDHPVGSTVLTVTDVYAFSETGGTLEVGGETLTYTATDDDASTITLAGVTTAAHADMDAVTVLPRTTVKTATVMLGDRGESIDVRVKFTQYPLLTEGIRDPTRVKSVVLRDDDGDWVIDDVIGWDDSTGGDGIDPAHIAFPTITNLSTDPQPTDPQSWVGGGSSYSSVFSITDTVPGCPLEWSGDGTFANYDFVISPPGTGPANPTLEPFRGGTDYRTSVFDGDQITLSFSMVTGIRTVTLDWWVMVFDASMALIGREDHLSSTAYPPSADVVRPTWTVRRSDTLYVYSGSPADLMNAAYISIGAHLTPSIPVSPPEDSWLGSAMIDSSGLNPPFMDADTPGWTENTDGTAAGKWEPIYVDWPSIANRPTAFPPAPHTHSIADVDGLQTELDTLEDATAAIQTTIFVPLTTVIAGAPELVWDADNQLVLTEVQR